VRRKPSKRTRTSALVPFSFAWPKPKIPFLAFLACLGYSLLLDYTETLFTQDKVNNYKAHFYYQILLRKSLSAPIGALSVDATTPAPSGQFLFCPARRTGTWDPNNFNLDLEHGSSSIKTVGFSNSIM